jgi:hypothetical protein
VTAGAMAEKGRDVVDRFHQNLTLATNWKILGAVELLT